MAKTLTIQIRPVGAVLERFRKTFKDAAAGGRVDRRDGVCVASIEAARNVLTPNRLALLHDRQRPLTPSTGRALWQLLPAASVDPTSDPGCRNGRSHSRRPSMTSEAVIREGQILIGPLFNEPMRVETVASGGPSTWTVGLVWAQTQQFVARQG